MLGRASTALLMATLALSWPAVASPQVAVSPQPPDPAPAHGDATTPAPQPTPLVSPAQPPIEPAAEAAGSVQRKGPLCTDFQPAPSAGWRALTSVRFPGPQGEVRITAGQTLEPGGFVSGLDVAAILQARCF